MAEGTFTDGGIEWQPEYRGDDIRDEGFCPKCGAPLSDLLDDGRGFCETHEWVFAEWTRPKEVDE